MFKFFKKKNIKTDKIKGFNRALSAIKTFIFIEEWENAYSAINEIKDKERHAYEELMVKISDSNKIDLNEKEKHTKIFNDNLKKLEKLKKLTQYREDKFNKEKEEKRFKIRFAKIRSEVHVLSKTGKNGEAMNLLTNFLEEHKDKQKVIKFFNKEKKLILKNIDKQRKKDENKVKHNAKLEAMKLMGETVDIDLKEEKKSKTEEIKEKGLLGFIKSKLNFYKQIKEKLKKKKILDEINLLIDEDSKSKNDIASKKLANIHKGLIKEIANDKMLGYDFYGKILGADKISGDAFGLSEDKEKYSFFLGDATGHGIRAGFIITLLSRLFNDFVKKTSLQELCLEINNGLKQNLKNRNFITGIFFEVIKKEIGKIKYVGMGHEPMLIYRAKENKVERLLSGGLAAGIRIIQNKQDIKNKELILNDGDVLVIYSDGIVEAKSITGEFYGIDGLEKEIKKTFELGIDVKKSYDEMIKNITSFKGGSNFDDDTTLLIIKRNGNKDIIEEENEYIKELSLREGLNNTDTKKLVGKTKDEIDIELDKIRREKEIKNIIKNLENLYYTGEILKLKQEAIRFIKKGYIHKRINHFLKKAIANETKYKINKKNQKIANKYNVLKELYAKGDYATVIQETEDIIAKDGSI